MKKFEQEEIKSLPSKYRPIGAWGYFGYNILFSIPLIGFICLVIFACSSSNINRRSYARSFFCVWIVALVFFGILLAVAAASGKLAMLTQMLQELSQQAGQQG